MLVLMMRKPLMTWMMRLGAAVLAVAAGGCDKVPLLAPTNSTIAVSASTRTLAVGETTEISAFVIESSGTPVQNGTTVRFTTSLGSVNPVEAQTRNGVAVTTFSAGQTSGVAEVRATSGGAGGGATPAPGAGNNGANPPANASSSSMVQITVGAAAAAGVVINASPSTVPPGGGTVAIRASALDANGNHLPGVPVSFSTTAGSLSAGSAVTDASGNATVQLTTGRDAKVTATVRDKTATVDVTATGANSVTLQVSPNPGSAGQPVTLMVTPTIGANNLPPQVSIDWGDGETANLGTVPAAVGAAHIYTAVGSYIIRATATRDGESFTTSTSVTITAASVTIAVTPASGTVGQIFTFTVTPAIGAPVQSVVINFGDGTTKNLGPITGQAVVTNPYAGAGTYAVQVTQTNVGGVTTTAATVVTVTP